MLHAQAKTAAATPAGATVTKEEVDSFMHHTFGWNPDLKWQVGRIGPSAASGLTEANVMVETPQGQQTLLLFISPDGKYAINGDMVPFGADPYAAAREQLKSANGPSKGPADAPLTIVEFSDLQCPHCKAAEPIIDKLLGDTPNARFVWENFPLTDLHNWAAKAAAYDVCVYQQNPDAFWKFVHAIFEQQESINPANADAKLTDLATQSGVNGQTVASCSVKPETKAQVDRSITLAKQLGLSGTPTLFLNGRMIQNVTGTPYEVLTAIAKFQAGSK